MSENECRRKGVTVSNARDNSGADPRRQPAAANDEIDFVDYFLVLLKHKRLILIGSVLPPLIVGLVLFWLPRNHTVSYTYAMKMSESELKVLEDKFYSAENIEKLADLLRQQGLEHSARSLSGTQAGKNLKRLAAFEVLPPLFDSKTRTFTELREKLDTKGSLLVLHIQNASPTRLREIALIVRRNFEHVIPLNYEKDKLTHKIIDLKADMAGIEETRYRLNLQLQRRVSTLDKLRHTALPDNALTSGDIVLQFDVDSGSAYLPLPYQVQAVQTQVINLEEEIRTNTELYAYYSDLLAMNETLAEYLDRASYPPITLGQYHSFLTDTLAHYTAETPHLRDHLAAYIKRIENEMASAVPVVTNPTVERAARGAIRTIIIVFAAAFVLSAFAAFLRDGLEKRRLSGYCGL